MTQSKRNTGGALTLRSLLPDFFDTDQFNLDHLLKRDGAPAVNISETDKSYEIEVAAPGLRKEDFKVSSNKGILTISAERKEETEEKKINYTRQEYNYHAFSRSFTLPQDAKEEAIKAHYENGVLKLSIAKSAEAISKAKHVVVA